MMRPGTPGTHTLERPTRFTPVGSAAVLMLVAALVFAGCAEATAPLLEPTALAANKKGGGGTGSGGGAGGASPGATVGPGDFALGADDAPALATTCPSNGFTKNSWVVVFGKSGCLVVTPKWTSVTYEPYTLVDDLLINVQQDKKTGRITHVRLAGQDVDGPEGIWHNTDWLPVEQPVVPTAAGFTLHVHARNVGVWRFDSHLADGNRVEMIGTISIGDIVYPAQ